LTKLSLAVVQDSAHQGGKGAVTKRSLGMPIFGDLARQTHWLACSFLRSSKFRTWKFLATALSAFLVSIFLPQWGHQLGQPLGSPAYAQVTTITNQAGGRFTSGGNTFNAASNQTTASLGTAGTAGAAPFTIVKTADRGAAEPGDIVTYRLLITNNTATAITPLVVADQMPLGVNLIPASFRYSPVNPPQPISAGAVFR
jgi:uncharacterized repeat protein (TIGR01451 family)